MRREKVEGQQKGAGGMGFVPYLYFQGNCAEALNWYAGIFGGTVSLLRYKDAPELPPEMTGSDLVVNGVLDVGGAVLMASDFPPGMDGRPQAAVSVSYAADSDAEGEALFERLSEGGTLAFRWNTTYWARGAVGMVRDRFGTHWVISGPQRPF